MSIYDEMAAFDTRVRELLVERARPKPEKGPEFRQLSVEMPRSREERAKLKDQRSTPREGETPIELQRILDGKCPKCGIRPYWMLFSSDNKTVCFCCAKCGPPKRCACAKLRNPNRWIRAGVV